MSNASDALNAYRGTWARKPSLRAVYADYFDRMAALCKPGRTLEIGGGLGGFKDRLPQLIASDVQYAPWLDLAADAQHLPFADGALMNIVMLDVLHHIEHPLLFLREAARTLSPGGRIVMIEPAITPGSSLFFRYAHPEPVRMSADPLTEGAADPKRDPYDSNQAIPTLLATRERERLARMVPELSLIEQRWFSFVAYPLSGGFQSWTLIPSAFVGPVLKIERALEAPLGRLFGMRLLLCFERRA
jgi:SAM-dependent methyltransferase